MATTDSGRTAISNVFFLLLRRIRFPLILLIVIYSVCVLGMTFMPGVDANGNPTRGMTFFESFYVMSYTGTTIGFGELPVPFSSQQRLWMTVCIYVTVIGWTYTLMSIIALMQDRGFRNALSQLGFYSKVKGMREPFYIVAGCGETGMLVCHGLDRLNLRFVLIEQDPDRLAEFQLEEFRFVPPMMVADVSQASVLEEAGLGKPNCKGVMALAEDDTINRSIAVAVRLMTPGVPVLARIRDIEPNEAQMGPFVGDTVINPFERFAEHLAEAVSAPQRYRLRETLTGLPGRAMPQPQRPPRGRWVVVGFGRFGQAIVDHLRLAGIPVSVVDNSHPDSEDVDVAGSGTDEASLTSAGIERAVGLVAGTANDLTNLAIAVTARDIKPDVFIVTRQNHSGNDKLFESFRDDLSMVPSRIVAQEFLALITTPLISRFLPTLADQDEDWCAQLLEKIEAITDGKIPEVWSLSITNAQTDAVTQVLKAGHSVRIGDLLRDPRKRTKRLKVKVLMLMRGSTMISLPRDDFEIKLGDQLLMASGGSYEMVVRNALGNYNTFNYLITGIDISGGYIWRLFSRKEQQMDPKLPQPFDPGYIAPLSAVEELPAQVVEENKPVEDEETDLVKWAPVAQPGEDDDAESETDTETDAVEDDNSIPWEPLGPDEIPPAPDPGLIVNDPYDD